MNDIKKSNLLKSIHSQIQKAESDYEGLIIQKNQIIATINHKKNQIQELKNQLKSFEKPKNITVSEHAILRYLERVDGINLEQIISKISTDKLKEMVNVLGSGTFPVDGKFSVKVKNNVVVSVFK